MRRAFVPVLLALSGLAAFFFAVVSDPRGMSAPAGGRHWAAAPLLAFTIVASMGGLVALAAGAPGRRGGR